MQVQLQQDASTYEQQAQLRKEIQRLQQETVRLREVVGWLPGVRGRLVWLEPLDMEPVPRSLNLLLAILARINAATSQFASRNEAGGAEHWMAHEPGPDH